MHVFVSDERAKLVNTLKDFMDKKKEFLECFMDRVPVEVAPDYRSIIPAEMYFNLIKDRISNCYYRSQEVSALLQVNNHCFLSSVIADSLAIWSPAKDSTSFSLFIIVLIRLTLMCNKPFN